MDAQPKNFATALAEPVNRRPQHRKGGQITPTTHHRMAGNVKCCTLASPWKTCSESSICMRCMAPFLIGCAGDLNDAVFSSLLAGAAAPGMSVTDAVGRCIVILSETNFCGAPLAACFSTSDAPTLVPRRPPPPIASGGALSCCASHGRACGTYGSEDPIGWSVSGYADSTFGADLPSFTMASGECFSGAAVCQTSLKKLCSIVPQLIPAKLERLKRRATFSPFAFSHCFRLRKTAQQPNQQQPAKARLVSPRCSRCLFPQG